MGGEGWVSSVVVRGRWKPGRIRCFPEPRETLLLPAGGADQSLLLGNGRHCQGCSGTALRGRCRACCAAWREAGGGGGCLQCRRGGRSPAAPWEVGVGAEEVKVSLLSTFQPPEMIVRLRWNPEPFLIYLLSGRRWARQFFHSPLTSNVLPHIVHIT